MERQAALPDRIGLCLSGGGFRAAAFHLGVLMYLDRVKLLERVRAISTVSGGTFTGAKYLVSRIDGNTPEQFFQAYYRELKETRIFPAALELLGSKQPILSPSGRKDVITCAAQSYAETLFARNGTQILFGEILNGNTAPLEDITFNATDFRTGYAFRFQKTATGWIGNKKTRISPGDAAHIRLADIVAASSCFPAGFEPIDFPNDFQWPDGVPQGLEQLKCSSLPLMDGGVYDNQGIQSLMMRIAQTGVDMIVISDADRQKESLYETPASVGDLVRRPEANLTWKLMLRWNPTLGALAWLSWILVVLCGLSAITIGINIWNQLTSLRRTSVLWLLFSNILPFVLTTATLTLAMLLRSIFKNSLLTRIPQLKAKGWTFLSKVSLVKAIDMCWLRMGSLKALASDVFMRRIRSEGYGSIYEDSAYRGKIVANSIYSVTSPWVFQNPGDDSQSLPGPDDALCAELKSIQEPTAKLLKVITEAAGIETLLWFENERQLPTLVSSGQATTCLNLLKFVARTRAYDASGSFSDPAVQELWMALCQDWDRFRNEPSFLLSSTLALPNRPNHGNC